MKNALFTLIIFWLSKITFANDCTINELTYSDYSSNKVSNPIDLVRAELEKSGYIIDEKKPKGISLTIETGRAMPRKAPHSKPVLAEVTKGLFHLVSGRYFQDAYEAEVFVKEDGKIKKYLSTGNRYAEMDEIVIEALSRIEECI